MAYNPRYSNGHRARQLRARVLAEETHCALCGEPVDTTLPARHPAAPEVDHMVPVARGGALYARDNAALIHRACNAWKGRSEEHTSELQSRGHLVCRLLLEKKNTEL